MRQTEKQNKKEERERNTKKEREESEELWQATKCFLFVARDARQ